MAQSARSGREPDATDIELDAILSVVELLTSFDTRGRRFVLRAAAGRLGAYEQEAAPTGLLARLSNRERQVFDMLIDGRRNREIAKALGISDKTVETHREHILKKLELHSTIDLVRVAVISGVLRVPPDPSRS
jgi:DNA-binding NarL/FixJ family response regulator